MGMDQSRAAGEQLRALADGQAGVLEALAQMELGSLERSKLDEETYLLVRLAALVATDAAPVAYRVHLGGLLAVPAAKVLATLIAIAPVVGSARVLSAASKLLGAGLLEAGPSQFTRFG
jgi:alkylhydroperoxidase/carboxymuconolactone decarboxylase family protein YurZ